MQRDLAPRKAPPPVDGRPVQLHVIHDLGGGTAKWLEDYSLADGARNNLVLKSLAHEQSMGVGLALYARATDELPLRVWKFAQDQEIPATVTAHPEYRRILDEIVTEYHVDVVLVSSLIGHSLDVLDTGLRTVFVAHDYFPYCPAINLHFGSVCQTCDGNRVVQCYRENPKFNPFVTFLPGERMRVREKFMELVRRPNVVVATPSQSVADNLTRLNEAFREVAFTTIPHGYGHAMQRLPIPEPGPHERLRILVLGQLSVLKGMELLRGALGSLTRFAEIWLLGPREVGEAFRFDPGVQVISQYNIEELPQHIANINPHVALLASIAPETFNYTLTELMMLGVPVAATRVGSFPERIRHGENGYLFDPDVASLASLMGAIDTDRETLARVRRNLDGWKPRTPEEMVADYHRIAPVATPASAAAAATPAPEAPEPSSPTAQALATQTITVSSMWKDMRSLHTQLSVVTEARNREQRLYEHKSHELIEAQKKIKKHEAALIEKDGHIHALTSHLQMKNAQVAEFLASTSWKISSPIRALGHSLRRVKALRRHVEWLIDDRQSLPGNLRELWTALRAGGVHAFKRELQEMQSETRRAKAWAAYRRTFRTEVRPLVIGGVCDLPRRPLISIVVPVFNTNEDMLRQMLNSVRDQLYPNWELCLADDGSTAAQVPKVLAEYVAADPRIKARFIEDNRGIAHALNRALELVTGEFVVLLDHDDLLEEQALFRVVQSVLEDDPDMLYGDEALVEADANIIRRYAFRPAFSPELLRSHPYIVHPIGFRTQLLRDIGGFDEKLAISQDYDLVLRATEKARTIVHIPEILYRWRIHAKSAGLMKQEKVMDTSKEVLRRHLERSGIVGTVEDGPSFNLFDVRYPLRDDLRVAIVIPTKNHGALLRQCIERIWATVGDKVRYDVVVIDHESDDAGTIDYLKSIAGDVRVLRYEGPFNFSAINNFAIAKIAGPYTHYLLCNNDIEAIEPGWLERMLELGQQPSIGIVGAKLLYPDRKTIQHAGVCVGAFGAAEHYGKRQSSPAQIEPGFSELLVINHEVAAVTAACMLVRREAFEEIGGFDESIAVGFGDVDLCLRAWQRGYRIVFCPYAVLIHHESFTRGTSTRDPHPEDSALYRFKWKDFLEAGDPYYSPGLSETTTAWAIKLPLHCRYEIRRRIARRDPSSGREQHSFSKPLGA